MESIFIYFQGKGKWKPWQDDVISAPPISRDTPPNQILVTTLDSVRYLALFKLLVTHHKPVMMVGPTGTGKSSYIIVSSLVLFFCLENTIVKRPIANVTNILCKKVGKISYVTNSPAIA